MRTNTPLPGEGVPAWRRSKMTSTTSATTAALYFHHSGCRNAASVTGHCSRASFLLPRPTPHASRSTPHASRSTPHQRVQAGHRPSPAGYCHPPTPELTKTERGPISTSGPSISVCHQTGRSLRASQSFQCDGTGLRNPPESVGWGNETLSQHERL